jgi:UPF0716 protein FxsA
MRFGLFLLFVAIPLLELALLIKLGQSIGFWATFAIIVVTALAGSAILHRQGFAALRRGIDTASGGKIPVEPIIDGAMLMVAGSLLLAPGLITDTFGLLLLVPPIRRNIGVWGFKRLMTSGSIHVSNFGGASAEPEPQSRPRTEPGSFRRRSKPTAPPVIDGEFERIDETARNHRPSDQSSKSADKRSPP